MEKLPLEKRLRKRVHLETAQLQDLVMDELCSSPGLDLVLHGGTAIWRIYSGNRFSEDLDLYMEKWEPEKVKETLGRLAALGAGLEKFKATENTVFSSLRKENVSVKVEVSRPHRKLETIVGDYERANGSCLPVRTLAPEEMFKEKVDTYLGRRLIRDAYDIYHLYPQCQLAEIKAAGAKFVREAKEPVDESVLKAILLTGAVPTYKEMLAKFKRWFG